MEDQNEPLIGVEQLAAEWNVKDSWVYAQTAANKIPFVKLGKYVRFRRADLNRWLDEQRSSR